MAIGVTLMGIVMAAIGVIGAANPSRLMHWVLALQPRTRFGLAIALRLAIGIYFLLAAPSCRGPGIVRVVGYLALLAVAVLALLGPARLDAFVQWWIARSRTFTRLWCFAAVGFGVLLIYAGA